MFAEDSTCPCGSGALVACCSCKDRRFVPLAVKTSPPGVTTGIRIGKCYANPLADCRPPLSADHAVARSISRAFEDSPIVRALHDGSKRTIPPSAQGRRVLCKRHNSALSHLDEVGRRFVCASRDQLRHRFERRADDTHVLFNGYDVERWMLKVLCTMAHGQPASRFSAAAVWRVPEPWCRILFQGRPLPPGAGIYVPKVARGRFDRGLFTAKIVGYPRTGALPRETPLLDPRDGALFEGSPSRFTVRISIY